MIADTVVALARLAGMISLIAGLIALISPKLIGAHSRKVALPLILGLFACVGLTMIVDPQLDQQNSPGSSIAGGILFILPWLWVMRPYLRRYADGPSAEASVAAPELGAIKPGFFERVAAAYGKAVEETRAQLERDRAEREIRLAERSRNTADRSEDRKGFGAVGAATKRSEAIIHFREPIPEAPPQQPETPRRRRASVIDYDPNRPKVDKGRSVRFEYVDSQGEITEREVMNWEIIEGRITGFCTLRRQGRTFRMDRVINWQEYS